MNEMIDRVAAALLRHAVGGGEEVWAILPEEAFGGRPRDAYRAQARAAIEAMREPTEAKWYWLAMIVTALLFMMCQHVAKLTGGS
jgi:hypothetical protein